MNRPSILNHEMSNGHRSYLKASGELEDDTDDAKQSEDHGGIAELGPDLHQVPLLGLLVSSEFDRYDMLSDIATHARITPEAAARFVNHPYAELVTRCF